MKKFLFLIFFSGATTAISYAQTGIKFGAGLATVAEQGEDFSRDDVDNNSILTPVIGLSFDMGISNHFTIQPELLFSQSGGRNTYSAFGTTTETSHRISYLEIPVLAKLQLGGGSQEGVGFYVAAGPWAGFALNGKYKSVTTSGSTTLLEINRDYTFDEEDDTKRLNYGVLGAVGLRFGRTTADLRYNYGINNLLDNDTDNNNDNKPILQTRGIVLSLGYSF